METSLAKDKAKWVYWGNHIKKSRASRSLHNAYRQREGLKPMTVDYWRPLKGANDANIKPEKPAASGNDMTLVPVKLADSQSDTPIDMMALVPSHPVGQPLKLKSAFG
jgi:hypothetical protein